LALQTSAERRLQASTTSTALNAATIRTPLGADASFSAGIVVIVLIKVD